MEKKNYTVVNGRKVDIEESREEVIQEQNLETEITISLPENLMNMIEEISSIYCEGIEISQEEFIKGLVLHGLGVVNNIILQEKQATLNLREQAKQSILSVFKVNDSNKIEENTINE